jgi:hypothetical protein
MRSAKIRESKEESGRLAVEFDGWLKRRRDADHRGQYHTQLDLLERVVCDCLERIEGELESIPRTASEGELYERCRKADRHVVFVWRLWDYFREKWDQRDDRSLGPALAVADEIVWSCYATPFRQLDTPPGPAPLAYVTADFSPHAIVRAAPPVGLRPSDGLLRDITAELPMPLVGIPPICVARPWWSVMLAHEVGHQLYLELGGGIADAIREKLERAVASVTDPACALEWSAWASEIFADVYATAMVGGAHLWALTELERGPDEAMLRRPLGYPPPLVRHTLGRLMLATLGLEPDEALPPTSAPPRLDEMAVGDEQKAAVSPHLEACPAVARSLTREALVGEVPLPELAAWRPEDLTAKGRAGRWRRQYAAKRDMSPEPTLAAARLATVGALAEWIRIASEPGEAARKERTERLRARALQIIPECREEGVRAAKKPAGLDVAGLAASIAERVLTLPAEEAEGSTDRRPAADLAGRP